MSKPYIIAVAGASGSGKTTFVKDIVQKFGGITLAVLSQDQYYRDMAHLSPRARARVNYDHPDQIDAPLLVQHLAQLAGGKTVAAPQYDFSQHARMSKTTPVKPCSLLVCEGTLTLHYPALRELADLKIFMDVPTDICLVRRIIRDQRDRGRTVAQITSQYLASVQPMFQQYVAPSKEFADIIVHNPRDLVKKLTKLLNIKTNDNS